MGNIDRELIASIKKDNMPRATRRAKFLADLARSFVRHNEKFLRASAAMTDAERIYFQAVVMEEGMKIARQKAVEKVNGTTKKRRRRAAA
jgi:hypothetical protein